MPAKVRSQFKEHLETLQKSIVDKLEALHPDGPKFKRMEFSDSPDSHNVTYLLQRTDSGHKDLDTSFAPIEKGVLVLTFLTNDMPTGPPGQYKGQPTRHVDITTPAQRSRFYAAHLSVVIYPRSPHAPTGHGSWRYFEEQNSDGEAIKWWFGGTTHLIPTYPHKDDWYEFHQHLKKGISDHGAIYNPMKQWCDTYFYNPYRKESVGIGGIFYDQLNDKPNPKLDLDGDDTPRPRTDEECLAFVKSAGETFISAYFPVLERRASTPFTHEERESQLIHRGRFVEQLLLVDEGIKFGFDTKSGAADRILLILPESAQWSYTAEDLKLPESHHELASLMKGEPQTWA